MILLCEVGSSRALTFRKESVADKILARRGFIGACTRQDEVDHQEDGDVVMFEHA